MRSQNGLDESVNHLAERDGAISTEKGEEKAMMADTRNVYGHGGRSGAFFFF
jgi:hypothetical protein